MNRLATGVQAIAGKVYFVGAGPGDPGLITLRGAELLRTADVVLYDGLVNLQLLDHARDPSLCYSVGKHGESRIWTQAEINTRLTEEAASGKSVVRLKGGDPIVFGRLAEECDALRDAGIEFEIVPGITAALAAGAYAGIPITHRGYASAVALVTGHEEDGKAASSIDWQSLARFPGTLVIYMGVTTAKQWSSALMDAGMPGTTPAAIVRRCSWPDQETRRCTLAEVAECLTPASKMRPPVIVVLGPVVGLQAALDWFSHRPLFGTRVLVTRPAQSDDRCVTRLQEAGAQVLLQPAIEIAPPSSFESLDQAIRSVANYQWLVFSSANGVHAWMSRMQALQLDARSIGPCQIDCVGPATKKALESYFLRCDMTAESFAAEGLIAALKDKVRGQRMLLVRASRGREVLQEQLLHMGAQVDQVVGYQSLDVLKVAPEVERAMRSGHIDWVTVTSSAIAKSLVQLFGCEALSKVNLASISPITSQTLREAGLEPTVEATEYHADGLVDALCNAHRNLSRDD